MLFALALILLAASAFAAATLFRLSWAGTLVATYVVAFAEIVFITEFLSAFGGVRAATFLPAETAVAFAVVGACVYRGIVLPPLVGVGLAQLRRHPVILILGSAVALGLVFELGIAVAAVPNNWDSMTYHLSRAAGWYQQAGLGHLEAHSERENVFPPNAEILSLFTMTFAHTDRFTALPQFLSELALLVAIFGIARRLGFGRSEAAFASLVFATLSDVALEATTTQNDLVVTACLVSAAYFLLGRSRAEMPLAGLALALAIGTKLTALFAVPILFLLALVVLRRRELAQLAGAFAIAFLVVAAPVYAMNLRDYGTLLGPRSVRSDFEATHSAGAMGGTFGRVLYRFVDFSGAQYRPPALPKQLDASTYVPVDISASSGSHRVGSGSFFLLNGRANEDISYFGPLGVLLVLPIAFGYLVAWARRRTLRVKGVLALALPLYAAEIAVVYAYNPFIGRFLLVPVGLVAALLAQAYGIRGLREPVALIGVLFLGLALVHNEQKPIGLGGSKPIWTMSRPEAEALSRPGIATALEAVDRIVPDRARVGFVLGRDGWDYPLYGKHLKRRLIRLPSGAPLSAATRLHLQWVVMGNVDARGSGAWVALRFKASGWSLMAPRSSANASRLVALARSPRNQSQAARPIGPTESMRQVNRRG